MELDLQRDIKTDAVTLGSLSIDGAFECFTLEDPVRPEGVKIHGETAIPAGRYRVILTQSPRFGRVLPLLLEVPGFEGVRIHPGNDTGDTEGCILVGTGRTVGPAEAGSISHSRDAFSALFVKLEAALSPIWITIQ